MVTVKGGCQRQWEALIAKELPLHFYKEECSSGIRAKVASIVHSKRWEPIQVEKQIVVISMATKFEIEKFNRVNFSLWKLRIRQY
ncbi:hypothetical protein Patl1_10290 [Pistacia atlantica]|uniref:Uncharacterized protein n=1 Tax=Pistacia atlantica TaxID=434234 RepID=A0ACC1AB45_9ROSI|nr:hypothetical protein Patl1_10290 [Pistacia atlantica]